MCQKIKITRKNFEKIVVNLFYVPLFFLLFISSHLKYMLIFGITFGASSGMSSDLCPVLMRVNLKRVTSNTTSRRFPPYLLLYFLSHILPSPMFLTEFSFCFFPCHFNLAVVEQQHEQMLVQNIV